MHVVRNENDLTREFYTSEGGVIDALENYDTGATTKGGVGATQWLTDQFLQDAKSAAASHRFFSVDANGQPIAEVRVRCITATSTTGNTRIQIGAYKVFNKF